MVSALLVSAVMAAAPTDADRAAYESAQAQAGRDADAHVKLALWCEQHGMTAERARQLAQAILIDPKNAAARGLMGLVQFGGSWQHPEDLPARLNADAEQTAKFTEYVARRARTPHTANAQWKLAIWCEENGLTAESVAHLWATLRIEPGREAAWKRLGYKKHGQRWVTDAQLAAEKAEEDAQKRADKHWKPLLSKWHDGLTDKTKREDAERSLADVTDLRATPSVWAVFAPGNEQAQLRAIQLFGQIEGVGASRALAMLAIQGRSTRVRTAATQTLRGRDAREFVGMLIGLVRTPVKYQVRPGTSSPGQPAGLFVETARYNVIREYALNPQAFLSGSGQIINPPAGDFFGPGIYGRTFASWVPFDPFSVQNLMLASQPFVAAPPLNRAHHTTTAHNDGVSQFVMNATAAAARQDVQVGLTQLFIQEAANLGRQRLMNDVAALEALNTSIHNVNSQVLPVLNDVTGQDLGESEDSWRSWWSDQSGRVYDTSPNDKPTFTEFVPNPVGVSHSCFGAGTPVRTLNGLRSIELVRVGDQLLTQNGRNGALGFEPVVTIYHNRPAATLRIRLGDDTIVVTGIHRFWKAGHGWVMARALKPGDAVRTVGGQARVVSVADAPVQHVFNLEVAGGHSFFVGDHGALVHDNSLVQPVAEPFDAPASLAQGGGPKAQ